MAESALVVPLWVRQMAALARLPEGGGGSVDAQFAEATATDASNDTREGDPLRGGAGGVFRRSGYYYSLAARKRSRAARQAGLDTRGGGSGSGSGGGDGNDNRNGFIFASHLFSAASRNGGLTVRRASGFARLCSGGARSGRAW